MAKLIFYICIAMFVGAVIAAPKRGRENAGLTCGRAGDSCHTSDECCREFWCHSYAAKCVSKQGILYGGSKSMIPINRFGEKAIKSHEFHCASRGNCCGGLICHRYANRCTVEITPEMLVNQRNNLRRTGIDVTH